MARFQLYSDIHFEFLGEKEGKAYIKNLPKLDVDGVIIAGDIGDFKTFPTYLKLLCEHFAPTPILYVAGNHEHYHGSIAQVRSLRQELAASIPNLINLDRSSVQIGGVKVSGATLWFGDDPLNVLYKRNMGDFYYVKNLESEVYNENKLAREFFESEEPQIIVTHHLPFDGVIHPQYAGSPLNRFFVGATEEFVRNLTSLKVWCYGHTHTPTDETIYNTRFICNPYAYPSESKKLYRNDLIVEI